MTARRGLIAGALALAGAMGAAPAAADPFAGATRVALGDLAWPLVAACDRGDDVENRQCRLVRDARLAAFAGTTLLVEGEARAFEAGPWNTKRLSVPVTISGCVACGGLALAGRTWHVVAASTPARVDGGKVQAGLLYDSAKQFVDAAAGERWRASVKAVRVELLVKVPAQAPASPGRAAPPQGGAQVDRRLAQVGGKDVLQLDVVGYRVITPCDGAVIVASPASADVAPDKRACAPAPAAP